MSDSDKDRALVPTDERTVLFYGDEIKGVGVMQTPTERTVYVPVRPLCDFLGVDYSGQRQRIDRDPVLSEVLELVLVSTAGGPQAMPCIPLDYLNGWLFGINANRVKKERRDKVIKYQKECYSVLAKAFQDPIPSTHPLAQVREMGLAIARLAEEQIEMEMRLTGKIDDVSDRVVALEERLAPGKTVTEEQASQISQAVKAVAMKLSEASGRNEYGGVYGELYRRFSITSYKLLPAAKFQEAMDWLTEWHGSLTGEEPF